MKFLFLASALFLSACGPDWGDCADCGDKPAPQPPVVVSTPPAPCGVCKPTSVCKTVCTCTEKRYVCKQTGKDTAKKSDCKCGVEREYTKCTKEETKCN